MLVVVCKVRVVEGDKNEITMIVGLSLAPTSVSYELVLMHILNRDLRHSLFALGMFIINR